MRNFSHSANYKKAQPYTQQERLPIGGYVLKVLDVEYKENDWGDQLVLSYDIEEGEQKGFYRKNYKSQTGEDKKWKGTTRIAVPKDDGTEEDEWKMRSFKTMVEAFEDSNDGYHWDWNEATLKGKLIGGVFNNKEWEMNGRSGFFTNCHHLTSSENIRKVNFKVPDDTLLKWTTRKVDENGGWMDVSGEQEELPF